MQYAIQNLRTLVKNEKFIFAVMLVCVFISAWTMTFSYGLYHNYRAMSTEESEKGTYLAPEIAEGASIKNTDIVRYLNEISEDTLNAMISIQAMGGFSYVDEYGYDVDSIFTSMFVIQNGSIIPSPYVFQIWEDSNMIVSGRMISDSEESNGEKVTLVREDMIKNEYGKTAEFISDDHTTATFNGEEYKIIGTHIAFCPIVPLLAFPENSNITDFSMLFERPMSQKQYDELVFTAERVLPGVFVFPEIEFVDEESIIIYNNMMVVSVLIAALTIINFAFLYSFILQKRARTLAIMRICGCTRTRAWGICMGECCLICIPVFIIGVLTYIPFMHGVLSEMFVFIERAYSLPVYAILFVIYAVMLFVIMGIMLSRKMGSELAEGRKGGTV